jgi:hypothetical protein
MAMISAMAPSIQQLWGAHLRRTRLQRLDARQLSG